MAICNLVVQKARREVFVIRCIHWGWDNGELAELFRLDDIEDATRFFGSLDEHGDLADKILLVELTQEE